MRKRTDSTHEILVNLHCACRRVIFEALGIGEMKRAGLFMFCWYLAALFLALAIGMVRRMLSWYSGSIFFLSVFLIVLLTLYGLGRGRFCKELKDMEAENEN